MVSGQCSQDDHLGIADDTGLGDTWSRPGHNAHVSGDYPRPDPARRTYHQHRQAQRYTSMPLSVPGERTSYSDMASAHCAYRPDLHHQDARSRRTIPTPSADGRFRSDCHRPRELIAFDITATDELPDGLVFDSTTAITPSASCLTVGASGLTLTGANPDGTTALAWFLG